MDYAILMEVRVIKKIAIIVGHNEKSQGAYSKALDMTEYCYYKKVADKLKEVMGDAIDVYTRKPNSTYGAEMREVLNELNKTNYSYVLELHFNSLSNTNVQGVECIAFHKSKVGLELSNKFNNLISKKMNIPNRGIIKVDNPNQRGAYGICKSKPPYVLIETFFGSNEKSKDFTVDKMVELLVEFIKG